MYSISDAVRDYIRTLDSEIEYLNSNPVRYNVHLDLGSDRKILNSIGLDAVVDVLSHLAANSLRAMSGVEVPPTKRKHYGEYMIKNWLPDVPGNLIYRTFDIDGIPILEAEDDGCGINFYRLEEIARKKLDREIKKEDLPFTYGITTKKIGFPHRLFYPGGAGLSVIKERVNEYFGDIFLHGTAYMHQGKLVKEGQYAENHTGTVMRIEFSDLWGLIAA